MHKMLKRVLALFFILTSTGVWAQDVTGRYRLDVVQDSGFDDCVWTGSLELSQPGANPGPFTGDGAATLISGGGLCTDFSGSATGTITGSAVDFGIGTGGFGTVVFNGTVDANRVITGAWAGLGVTGTWTATPVATAVPVLPLPSLVLLMVTIAGLGYLRASENLKKEKAG